MSNCADCGVSFSDIKNRVLLQTGMSDISKWDEHIYQWIVDAEREIGTFGGLLPHNNYKIELDSANTKIPLPDDLYTLVDACFGTNSSMYTGVGAAFNKSCMCGSGTNGTSCGCIKWYVNGCYIYTSRAVDEVTISYLSVPMDEEGFPYVKEDHVPAIIAYIKYALLQSRFDDGKVPMAVYQTRYREWLMRKLKAKSRDATPNDAEMERLSNIWNSKLPVSYRATSGRNRDYILVPI